MKTGSLQWLKGLPALLAAPRPDPARQAQLIISMQRRIVLPVRIVVVAVVLYYVFSVDWSAGPPSIQTVILEMLRSFLIVYVVCNVIAAAIFYSWKWFPTGLFQWLVFILGLLDGLFVSSLMVITGGWQSIAFWLFPVLIVLNSISIPLAVPQFVLNLLLSVFFIGVGIVYANMGGNQVNLNYVPGISPPHLSPSTNTVSTAAHTAPAQPRPPRQPIIWDPSFRQVEEETPARSFLLCLFVLLLLTLCCYGVQSLAERRRRELEEAREFAVREAQLQSAGRLAAELAHQIKNPLAVINNAAFSLQRSLRENKNSAAQQIEIIQEEVARADRVITQIMGYAQLSEGRVEKLDVIEEIEGAIAQVFPPAVPSDIAIFRQFADYFPPLLMQRGHLSEIFINLLKNAREAVGRAGSIRIKADCLEDNSIEISIRDSGRGIPPDKMNRIFEAYYTSKSGGSGMGLAIVRHNTELYGGAVRVNSELGRGAEFILTFPAKANINVRI
ncbi:MAG TPA: HAMP domain-containing sensor histidine kinase [Candidatus Sulfotelmatobacter sp.]|nr:HAMP domain-containing sensor histidine kinase [Candidatus Sulfotelmatobacter sp.]